MKIVRNILDFFKRRFYLISWISLVIYLFYSTSNFYLNGRQFYYLRRILGLGLCISRGTAAVLNLCSALVLLPLCKKLNQILYHLLAEFCPGLFFYWLESAKSFHMTVAITLVLFAVIHSISHFVNLWNFSRGYDEKRPEINFASYRNENPLVLLMSHAGLTGTFMLLIALCMGATSLRVVRRKFYNTFWYTHQLYLLFLVLLIVHPLSGVLKEEVLADDGFDSGENDSHFLRPPNDRRFVSIKSKTWLWMIFPLCCFSMDLMWRIFSRNNTRVNILEVQYMSGQTISLKLSCPRKSFVCRMGQYVLLQCPDISLLEWHPFTLVKIPESSQEDFVVWIRVKGDWTENFERLLIERVHTTLSVLVDGPFSSPMEGVGSNRVAFCVAAGVGITPFVTVIYHMLMYPRNNLPGRIHLLWIVRHEEELTWLAELLNKTLCNLRNANRPDRLHIELYVTNVKSIADNLTKDVVVAVNGNGAVEHKARRLTDDEEMALLTPNRRPQLTGDFVSKAREFNGFNLSKEYPILGCRVKRGRPHWDRVFGYWVHLYPKEKLNLYCCGPKKLVKVLRDKCRYVSGTTKTKISFVHEGFS